MKAYTWNPLPDAKRWIRIFSLEHGNENEPLVGSLELTAIDSGSKYSTTSYFVGKTETPHEVLIREQGEYYRLPVTKNLFEMLLRFRSDTETRRLWVDAICIDQKNFQEKEDQIMLMHEIYKFSQRVLINLGQPEDTTAEAIYLMNQVHRAMTDTANLQLPIQKWMQYHRLPPSTEPSRWEPLKDFFCRPWFARKWTVQECVLPPIVTFHCGEWESEWDFMMGVIRGVYWKGLGVVDHTTYSKAELRPQLQQGLNQFQMTAILRGFFAEGVRLSFMDIIYRLQISKATDLRDHLFALLPLARDSDGLKPEYGATTILEICLKYAWFFLTQRQNLEVLYRAGLQEHKLLAPSWIPNWYGKHSDFGFEYADGPWDPLIRPTFLNIARGTHVRIERVSDPTILRINGVVIDKVKELANKHLKVPQRQDKDFLIAQQRRRLEDSDSVMSSLQQYPTGEALQTVQWRTLICNVTMSRQKAPDDLEAAYIAYRKCMFSEFSDIQDMRLQQKSQEPFREAEAYNSNKILGLTEGGYVGLFNKATREGDVVVAFFGGEFPFVVRPRQKLGPEDFELVGQCYVHGLMEEGQFDIKSSKHKPQWFQLGSEFEFENPFQPA